MTTQEVHILVHAPDFLEQLRIVRITHVRDAILNRVPEQRGGAPLCSFVYSMADTFHL